MDERKNIIRDGYILVQERRIVSIGRYDKMPRWVKAEHQLDATGKIIMPGLIDTHIHLAQALLRGAADDLALVDWLQGRVWPLQGNFTQEDGLVSSELCMLEMIKSGTTTFLESGLHKRYGNHAIAQLTERVGIRGVLSKMIMDGSGYGTAKNIMHPGMIEDKDECIKEAIDLYRRWHGAGQGRVKVWLAARSLGAVSPELYREVSRIATELDTGVTMHLNEVKEDSIYSLKEYGVLPVFHMNNVGMLGRRRVFAHMVWATDEEIKLLAETGSSVSHCPTSNAKLASGIAKIPEMKEAGVNISLGCDGAPCNNTYDMIKEMKIASLIQKARKLDPTCMRAYEVLELATINGAKALGMQDTVGSLEEGKLADILILNSENEHGVPNPDPVSAVVYSLSSSDVETVIINGKIIMHRRSVLTIDEERTVKEAKRRAEKLLERAGIAI